VIDGEIIALDLSGGPSFNLLQNHGSSKPTILYYYHVIDVMLIAGHCSKTIDDDEHVWLH